MITMFGEVGIKSFGMLCMWALEDGRPFVFIGQPYLLGTLLGSYFEMCDNEIELCAHNILIIIGLFF